MSCTDVLSGKRRWHIERADALEVLRSLPSASVDCVITDPPYSSGGLHASARLGAPSKKYVQSGRKVLHPDFAGDNRDQRSYLAWCALWLTECLRVLKPGEPVGVFADWRQVPVTTDAVQAAGFIWRGLVPWDKTCRARPQRGRFCPQAEYFVWGSHGAMPSDRGVKSLPGAYTEAVDTKDKHHICGKPVALMQHLVRICRPGGVILDPFAGSASTGVACALEGYRFIGVELTETYADIARKRLTATHAELR